MCQQTSSQPLISVIVPIYNMSGKLSNCLRCLTQQTYHNLEILLVDDGSKDDSWAVMQSWAARDHRIRLYHKENGGVSSARNYGLDRMAGTYCTFVDPDDTFSIHLIEWLYKALCFSDVPLSVCRIRSRRPSEADILPPEPSCHEAIRRVTLDSYDAWAEYAHVQCYAALYRADLLKSIRFDESISYAEDALFFTEALLQARELAYMPERLYYYIKWSDSALRRPYTASQFSDVLVWEKISNLAKEGGWRTLYKSAMTRYAFACTRAFYYSFTSSSDCSSIRKDAVQRLRQNRSAVRAMPSRYKKEKYKAFVAMLSPWLGEQIWRLTRK